MKCPVCGDAELIHDTRDIPYTYKGELTSLSCITGDFCPACGEAVLDSAESSRVSALMYQCQSDFGTKGLTPSFDSTRIE